MTTSGRIGIAFVVGLMAARSFPGEAFGQATAPELIPPAGQIKKDHPRLLLRPQDTPQAVSLGQLKAIPRDGEFAEMLAQLRKCEQASPQALAWRLTGEKADADKALAAMRAWKTPDTKGANDPFTVYFGCRDMALAYDWLSDAPGFTDQIKQEVRDKVYPLAEAGYKSGGDHIFHNYVWMWNCGAALWALAAAGDDPRCDKLLEDIRGRLNGTAFPAMAYLDGQPADSPGYWSLYCLSPGVITLMSAQSAFEQDLATKVAASGGDWLAKQLDNLAYQALPNMRNMPWGDQQGGGDGGIAHEMACNIDMMTWATKSPTGAYLSKWLAGLRGTKRFYGETAMFYFIYTRTMKVEPKEPPLGHLSGGKQGGNWYARQKWDDAATVVGFRCTDCCTGHNHFDQGSFVIYRQGLLAVDAGVYKNVGGAQQKTKNHNTLLFGGAGQRGMRPNPITLDSYLKSLKSAKGGFETGNMLFNEDKGTWAAAAGEFGQAYDPALVAKATRKVLLLRPGMVVVVDQLAAPEGKELGEVTWLLHVPSNPKVEKDALTTDNGKSYLRCRPLLPGGVAPAISDGLATLLSGDAKKAAPTWQVEYKYAGKANLTLVHLLETGDGQPAAAGEAGCKAAAAGVELMVAGRTFVFAAVEPFAVSEKPVGK